MGEELTPENLRPYLPQFQAFARLTSLTLLHFDPTPFLPVFAQYLGHLAQQMWSLESVYPPGPQDDILYFISRFPNLEDLGFNSFPHHNLNPSKEYNTSAIPELADPGRYPTSHEHERLEDRLFGMPHPTPLWTSISFNRVPLLLPLQSLTHVRRAREFFLRSATDKDL
jgi:hypothetical protein